ncbi:hypothetical protein [Solibacillus ferritrahens]|uniref:hypothetical protein n=1 Tax=Solibacillus ferritrahens TaxID=3098620 RepID=UPI003008A793
MISNREAAESLNARQPNTTFEALIERKKMKYGLTDEEAYLDIIRSSQTTNERVNKKLGLEG